MVVAGNAGCRVICGYIAQHRQPPLHQPLLSVTGWCSADLSKEDWVEERRPVRGATETAQALPDNCTDNPDTPDNTDNPDGDIGG